VQGVKITVEWRYRSTHS